MNTREIRVRLEKIMGETVTGDPPTKQAKELAYLTAETLLQVTETLDNMNETNKELDASNKELAQSTLQLANKTFWAQVVATGIAIIALLVALFVRT